MGWLIFSLVVLVLCIILTILNTTENWDSMALDAAGMMGGALSFLAAISIFIFMIDMKDDADVKIADYNNFVELTTNLGVPSEDVMEKTLDLNSMIIKHRVRSESFWTKGLYSKEVGALPLLDVPEVMKKEE